MLENKKFAVPEIKVLCRIRRTKNVVPPSHVRDLQIERIPDITGTSGEARNL